MASATESAGRALLAVGGLVRRAEVSADGRTLHQIGGREADSFHRDRWSYDRGLMLLSDVALAAAVYTAVKMSGLARRPTTT